MLVLNYLSLTLILGAVLIRTITPSWRLDCS